MPTKLTERDLDRAISWGRSPMVTSNGGRRIDTHIEFKPVAQTKRDICCHGECGQAHNCPRYQAANDAPAAFSRSWLMTGAVICACVVAALFDAGVWQWQ